MMKNKKLTGTARYASINALKGYDQSRRDDLESIGYVLSYLLRGNLPWQGIVAKTKEEKYAKILYKKQYITPDQLLVGYPSELVNYIKYCKCLEYEQEPDYDYLIELFSNIIKNDLKEEIDYKYDWIKNEIDLQKNIKENYITEEGINNNNSNKISLINTNNSKSLLNNNGSKQSQKTSIEQHKNKSDDNIKYDDKVENKDIAYYDDVSKELNINKKKRHSLKNNIIDKEDIDEGEENEFNRDKKRKNGACCILF